ncbi:MAG: choice-of-anchor Q domain-containing protein, partial [Planctomycetota bacterium]
MNRSLRSTRRLVALSGRAWDGFEQLEPRKLLATFVVDTTSDASTFNDGVTSLREAIELSNLTEVVDEIVFDESLRGQVITLTQGQLQVTNSAIIRGFGASLTSISGGDASRVFDINLPFGGAVLISDLTVRNGFVGGVENGGGVRVAQNATLLLERVGIRNNEARWGGGVFVEPGGVLTMRDSDVTDNRAAFGGGLGVDGNNARATVEGVTISGNQSGSNGAGVLVRGGAGDVTFHNVTISANTNLGGSSGGGIAVESSVGNNVTFISSIVAGNLRSAGGSPGDVTNFGGLNITGSTNNIIGVSSGGFADGENGNIVTDDPGLLPIGLYGGQIRTHALAEDSPAIDAGLNPTDAERDGRSERFFTRVFGDAADIGAFERQVATFRVDVNGDQDPGFAFSDDEGELSLYEAAILANVNPGLDFIRFTGDLDRLEMRDGEIILRDSVRIVGPGADKLLISANGMSRHFFVDNFNGSTEIDVAIIGLTLSSGRVTGGADGGSIGTRENLLLERVVFSSNQAAGTDAHGGAIDVFGGGSITVFDSLFQFNSADGDSGAIHLRSGRSSVIVGTTFSRNTAAESGGAIGVFAGSLSIESSTIAENRADSARQGNKFGGGLMILLPPASGSVSLLNTIFADNYLGFQFDENFDDIRNAAGLNMGLSRNNLIETTGVQAGGVTNGDNGNLVGIESGLLGLGEYGGSMRTHALRADSPAVDAGLFEGDPATTGADARGGVFKRIFGDAVDIGAVEYQLFDLTVDNAGDVSNGDLSAGDVTLREVLEIVSVNPGVETVRFSAALNGQTITLDGTELGVGPDTIIDGPGADRLTIDARGLSRVFRVSGTGIEENSETIIRGLAITGGLADVGDGGAGIRSSVQRLVLEGVHIYGNRLEETPDSDIGNQRGGAGLYVGGSRDVVIRNSTFNDNEGDGYGGAAYLNGMFEIESSTFANNRAKEEGGA